MAHIHETRDAETHFIINATTREISNADELPALVQHDHNSEVFTFVIPRYVDGHDMATCNKTRVHYINIDSSTKEQYADLYEVKDLHIDETDETKVVCTWVISRYATQYAGSLNFVLQYVCENDGVIDYSWNTAIFRGITVKNGINNAEQIIADYSDILEEWRKEIEEVIASGGIQPDHAQNDPTQPDYIKNRLAYRCRKFDDIEAVEYPEQIIGLYREEAENDAGELEIFEAPMFLKISEPIVNATSAEVIQEIIGATLEGEDFIFEEAFPDMLHLIELRDYYTDDKQLLGSSWGFSGEFPYILAIENDDTTLSYSISFEEDGEMYEYVVEMYFPQKGIYSVILDTDDNGIHYGFEKLLFKDTKKIDKEFLPSEALYTKVEVDDYPEDGSENPITSDAVYCVEDRLAHLIREVERQLISLRSENSTDHFRYTNFINEMYQEIPKKIDGPTVTEEDNGKILMVEKGQWEAVEIPFAEEEEY